MTAVRRIAIVVVGLMLILDGAALGYIKLNSGPTPSDEKSKLVLWVDDAGQAKAAGALLKEQGYEAVVGPAKRKTEIEADFRVVMKSTKKELLEPIAKVLRQGGHSGLSYSPDGTKLYYGGFYKQKSQAMRVAQRIKAQDQIVFDVVPGTKTVNKASNKVVMASVPSNMVDQIIDDVKGAKVSIADQSVTPLGGGDDSGGGGEEG
jgi:hypothetical protein